MPHFPHGRKQNQASATASGQAATFHLPKSGSCVSLSPAMLQEILNLLAGTDTDTLGELWRQAVSGWGHWDSGAIGGSTAAIALGAIWFFARVVRKIVGLLFMICVIYLTLRYACGIDLLQLLPANA